MLYFNPINSHQKTQIMGYDHFEELKNKVGKAKQFDKQTFEGLPTYDNYFYQHEGAFDLSQGNTAELRLNIPGGHYEIEAITRLYNNSGNRIVYACSLDFYLEDGVHQLWEGGELGSTVDSRPYILHFKTLSTFTKNKVIKFTMGGAATNGFLADKPMLMVKRVGAIRFVND